MQIPLNDLIVVLDPIPVDRVSLLPNPPIVTPMADCQDAFIFIDPNDQKATICSLHMIRDHSQWEPLYQTIQKGQEMSLPIGYSSVENNSTLCFASEYPIGIPLNSLFKLSDRFHLLGNRIHYELVKWMARELLLSVSKLTQFYNKKQFFVYPCIQLSHLMVQSPYLLQVAERLANAEDDSYPPHLKEFAQYWKTRIQPAIKWTKERINEQPDDVLFNKNFDPLTSDLPNITAAHKCPKFVQKPQKNSNGIRLILNDCNQGEITHTHTHK